MRVDDMGTAMSRTQCPRTMGVAESPPAVPHEAQGNRIAFLWSTCEC